MVVLAMAMVVVLAVSLLHATGARAALRTFNSVGVTANGQGYVPIGTDGAVYAYGSTAYHGNPTGFTGGRRHRRGLARAGARAPAPDA
ncbi:hypothetical protein, partial [Streptomyces xanthochromogenes]